MLKICIDPGHGGKDSGAVGNRLLEKDVVLNIAKILKAQLLEKGFNVCMTREDDTFIELKDRCIIANKAKADIFVSIHCNSAENKSAFGFEIYHTRGSIQGQKLCADIKLTINENKEIIRTDRGIKTANFTVLTGTNMPAVLIETAFISNIEDGKILKAKQSEFATAICKGICSYFGIKNTKTVEKSTSATQILSKPTVTVEQMQEWAKSKNNNKEFINLAELYYKLSVERGINPAVSYAQFAHETGFLYKVKSAAGLDESYHNPCGLKVPQGGGDYDKNAHMKFRTWHEGISAHLEHLALYAGAKGYPRENTLDPRHFPYLLGTAKTVEELSGKWAPSQSYGDKLKVYIEEMESIKVMENTQEPSNWAKDSWEKATELKLIDGTRPKDNITRQEVASIAVRLYELLKTK
ncbi:N-acetylmuramoyl-L-alanine amidase [Peptoanaerobacter stomatis]|uniref:N-acetylmuramoyl-L-alanine amidase n=1 Tax=Peptoanaerobacter stomatis TaxID=796937 RepID=J6HIZ1_9FIRM|nr:N-acetylmuramoyl-L-alanine amidase [Peptoanaerobacter stomatis]EJU22593.1 N-acetylmuramoyl-L-alanine amidase [Peptoanaerobacter stomatis]